VGAQTRVVRTRERVEVKTQGGERRESYRGNTDSIQHLPPKMKDISLKDEREKRDFCNTKKEKEEHEQ